MPGWTVPPRTSPPNLLDGPGPAVMLFMQVLGSPHNKGSRSWYRREGKDGRLRSHLNYLVFFLRCV